MKRYFKIIGTFLSLTSLVACQDLGTKLPKEDGEKKFAEILEYRNDNVPTSFTIKTNSSYSSLIPLYEENRNGTIENYGVVNLDKFYFFLRAKKVENVIGAENGDFTNDFFYETWTYYKDGYLYSVINEQSKTYDNKTPRKSYSKLAMSEAKALALITESTDDTIDQIDNLYVSYTLLSSGGIFSIIGGIQEVDLETSNYKSECTYYSKGGNGNLTVQVKTDLTVEQNSIQTNKSDIAHIEYKEKTSFTYEKYLYGNQKISVDYLDKDSKGNEYNKINLKIKQTVEKGSTTTYPKLEEYVELTENKNLPF